MYNLFIDHKLINSALSLDNGLAWLEILEAIFPKSTIALEKI